MLSLQHDLDAYRSQKYSTYDTRPATPDGALCHQARDATFAFAHIHEEETVLSSAVGQSSWALPMRARSVPSPGRLSARKKCDVLFGNANFDAKATLTWHMGSMPLGEQHQTFRILDDFLRGSLKKWPLQDDQAKSREHLQPGRVAAGARATHWALPFPRPPMAASARLSWGGSA